MAKVISDEILKLKIIINGDEAQKNIYNLEIANKKLGTQIADLTLKQKAYRTAAQKDSEEYKKNARDIASLTQKIAENKKAIDIEIHSMNNLGLTMEQLRKKASDLKFMLNNMAPGSKDFIRVQGDLDAVNSRLGELRNGSTNSQSSIQRLSERFSEYSGVITATVASLAAFGVSIGKIISLNNELTNAQTTVSKTTGLTTEEVKDLTATLVDLDTRTSKIDLLKIAEIGGRLGVPKAELVDFTREVDKMYVALGDSFEGGVEEVANKMGKIKNLFSETKDLDIATAYNQIGSAMNELGAAGAASEANIADFAIRVGALPESLKPTIAETLALGAAFEESGIDSERAGTAYTSFIGIAAKNTGEFAKVMNMSKKQVDDLINTDPTEFFMQFTAKMKGMSATDLSKTLDSLKLNDQYVKSIVGAAAENQDRYRNSIALSNEELKKATSLQIEFDKVNNNSAATFDKIKKKFTEAFNNETVAATLNWLIDSIGLLFGVNEKAEKSLGKFGNTMLVLARVTAVLTVSIFGVTTAIALYNGLVKDSIVKSILLEGIEKGRNVRIQITTALQNAYNLTMGYGGKLLATVTGALGANTAATNIQSAAQSRLNAVTKANPFGAVLAVLALLVTAYITYRATMKDVINNQQILNDINKQASQDAAKEISQLDQLYKKATNVKNSIEDRTAAAKRLLELYPEQFKNVSAEIIMNGKAENSYLNLRDAILQAARAKAAQQELEKRAGERLERDQKIQEEIEKEKEILKKPQRRTSTGRITGGSDLSGGGTIELSKEDVSVGSKYRIGVLENIKKANKIADDARDKFILDVIGNNKKKVKSLEKEIPNLPNLPGDSEKVNPTKNPQITEAGKKAQEERDRILKIFADANERALQLEDIGLQQKSDLQRDWYQKELADIIAQENAKIRELEKYLVPEADIAKFNKIIANEKNVSAKEAFIKERDQVIQNNKDIETAILNQKKITNNKIEVLNDKLFNENLKKEQEQLQQRIKANQNAINKALAENVNVEQIKLFLKTLGYSDESLEAIRTWNEGKEEIEKYYNQKSLDDQIAFLREKVEILQTAQALLSANPILGLGLNPAQIALMQEYIDKLNELVAAKNGLSSNEESKGPNFSSLSQFGAGGADLLGMNREQWDAMFTSTNDLATNINKVGAALQVAQNMFAQYSAFVQANEQAMLRRMEASSERKQRRLKTELLNGQINQETYKKLTIANEVQLEKKKAELALKAAKRERAMNIASAITGTAVAVVGALGNKPWTPFNIVLASLVGAMGALQLGTILSQPLPEAPGAEDGLYPVMRKQDGKVFNSRKRKLVSGMYSEPTLLVGEGGSNYPEMVIDGRTMKRLKPTTVQTLTSEVAQARGFENGMYNENTSASGNNDMMIAMMALIEKNIEVLSDIKQTGIQAIIAKNARNGKEVDEMRNEYLDLKNKNKH